MADRLQEAIREPANLDGRYAFISASIGIALGSNAYRSAEEILRDADEAMYRAKQSGKACHAFAVERVVELEVSHESRSGAKDRRKEC